MVNNTWIMHLPTIVEDDKQSKRLNNFAEFIGAMEEGNLRDDDILK
jgi:hypothetical protein